MPPRDMLGGYARREHPMRAPIGVRGLRELPARGAKVARPRHPRAMRARADPTGELFGERILPHAMEQANGTIRRRLRLMQQGPLRNLVQLADSLSRRALGLFRRVRNGERALELRIVGV